MEKKANKKVKIHYGPAVATHVDPDGSVTAALFSKVKPGSRYDNGVCLDDNDPRRGMFGYEQGFMR